MANPSVFDPSQLGEYVTAATPIYGQQKGDEPAPLLGHQAIRNSPWGPIVEQVSEDGKTSYATAKPGASRGEQVVFERGPDGKYTERQMSEAGGMFDGYKNNSQFWKAALIAAGGAAAAGYAGAGAAATAGAGEAAAAGTAGAGAIATPVAAQGAITAVPLASAAPLAGSGGVVSGGLVSGGATIAAPTMGAGAVANGLVSSGAEAGLSNSAADAAAYEGMTNGAANGGGIMDSAGDWFSKVFTDRVIGQGLAGIGSGLGAYLSAQNAEKLLDKKIAADAAEKERERQWKARNFGPDSQPKINWTS